MRQVFAAFTVLAAGGAAAAATVPTAVINAQTTTGKSRPTKYCFIYGKRSHHTSAQCEMIDINLRAYPYSPSNLTTFETIDQNKKAKLTTSSATEVNGIEKRKVIGRGH